MKSRRVSLTNVAIAALSAVIASQAPSGHALFQQALAKERVESNLPEATKLYERVVAEFASYRALAVLKQPAAGAPAAETSPEVRGLPRAGNVN